MKSIIFGISGGFFKAYWAVFTKSSKSPNLNRCKTTLAYFKGTLLLLYKIIINGKKIYQFLPSAEDNIYVGNQGSFQGYDRPKSLKQVVTAPLTIIKGCALSQ